MPTGLERRYGAGHLHFITASCYRRAPLLDSSLRRDMLLRVLEDVRQRYGFVVVGYVVMPEHIHLLISEPERGTPSVVVQALKLGLVQRLFPSVRGPRSKTSALPPRPRQRFWQRRFYDFNVWSAEKRVEKLRYLHRNPVQRGLVEHPEEWKWSSFRSYAFGETGPVRVNDWSMLTLKRIEVRGFGDPLPHFSQKAREMGHP